MPDIDIFDPATFFERKIMETEVQIIEKKTRLEIYQVNRRNVERALSCLVQLDAAQQKALQMELLALQEAAGNADKALEALSVEIGQQTGKLNALRAARDLVEVAARAEG